MNNTEYPETYTDEFDFLRSYLTGDEYILWKGRPAKGRIFSAADLFLIPFSLMWCGFAVFWEITAISSGAPFFFALFGLPFILVGIYLVFGRFFHTSYMRRNTLYAITNKRLIRKRGNKIDLLDGNDLPPMQVTLYAGGCGTITFGEDSYYYRRGRRYHTPPVFTLDNIPDVVQVQQTILNTFGE